MKTMRTINEIAGILYLNSLLTKKSLIVGLSALVLILFGDQLLIIFLHIMHVLIEVIESLLEHFLEQAFGISTRVAQIILFWIFLMIATYITWQLLLKIYLRLEKLKAWIMSGVLFRKKLGIPLLLSVTTLGATFLFLT